MLILPTQGKDFLRRCCTYFGIGGALILELTEYDKAEVNEIFQAIEKELQLTKKKFTVSSPVKSSKFSLSKERL